MKTRKLVEVKAETYAEEQFIMSRFPACWWNHNFKGKTTFYIPIEEEDKLNEALKEWREKNNG